MKPNEVGFDGSFKISCSGLSPKPLTINIARSNKGPDSFDTTPNDNFQLKNTFLWWNKDEPELLYRCKEGKLYSVNFEPINEH